MDVGWEGWQAAEIRRRSTSFPLSDDRVPHWGYMIKGCMRIKYDDHDEIINAGERTTAVQS